MQRHHLKRILVAIDLTPRGHRAFRRGLQLAIVSTATLRLVYVLSDELPQQMQISQETFAQEELAAHAARAREEGVPTVSCAVLKGSAADQLARAATEDESDLIVVGAHRNSSFAQDLLGTTAGKLLRSSDRPVLVARGEDASRYSSVVVAIDFSPASRRALRIALEWFSTAQISVISAYGKARRMPRAKDELAGEARRLALQGLLSEVGAEMGPSGTAAAEAEAIAVYGWPEDAIEDFIAVRKPGLVVVGTHGRSGIEQAAFGSVAEWVTSTATCDVLAVPPPLSPSLVDGPLLTRS